MNVDREILRERIRTAYLVHPALTRTMAEAYLDKYPADGPVWAMYGDTLRSMGCFAEARTALVTARGLLEDDHNKGYINRFMGELAEALGDYVSAEACYRQGAAQEPEKGFWLLYLGVTLRRQGRDPEAEECYRKALELKGDRDEYLLNLGYVLQARGELAEAAACFTQALAIDPQYELAKDSLEDVLQALAFQSGIDDGGET
jgi:tetratricopeptide (TPR) repeat protein